MNFPRKKPEGVMDEEDGDWALLEENEATQIFYARYKPKEKLGA